MNKFFITLVCLFFSIGFYAQNEITIVPRPQEINFGNGFFNLNSQTYIQAAPDCKLVAESLRDYYHKYNKLSLLISENQLAKKNSIILIIDKSLTKEAYTLGISKKSIEIKGGSLAGVFYGIQSLQQLSSNIQMVSSAEKQSLKLPVLKIVDEPRFKWRAYMLDESRYFQGEKFVKLMLDQMAMLKMNVFHWHLTDDAGWRIEIKKYPKLTEIGSKRSDSEIGTWKSGKTSGKPHSGFYTQDQIKDIVAYAAERHITIVPEFEMPGHSTAAIAAYTWLGTAGKEIEVSTTFGRHYDNYDITKPKVIQFIKDVLIEMFELFPSEVIHIGGDEVGYKVWEDSEHVQQYMKENGIKSPADLQIDFTNQISKFIEQNGRRMMGWNEIMGANIHQGFEEKKNDKEAETELAKNVIVHFWKGNLELATEAAEKGYGMVNSLHSNTYLDYSYKDISIDKAYSFNPIPKGLDQKYHANVYGLGCQMWTEWTPTNKDVEYQTFPRLAAYAEVGWTTLENKDFEKFKVGLENLQKHWEKLGINYAKVLK